MEEHQPVLLAEAVQFLNCRTNRVYVDGTVGGGGHSQAILERTSPSGRLIGLDWDEEALRRAGERLVPFGPRVELRAGNFRDLPRILEELSLRKVDGILLDLGLSTEQLEDRQRGFSFRWDAPLDMRMSRQVELSAGDLLRRLSEAEIAEILHRYGEERWARRIARAIVRRRKIHPPRTTRDLVEIIERSVPFRRGRIHPATRTFQALRIAVNRELENLEGFLREAPGLLRPEGRLCIISFHSLEDRLVKTYFRKWTRGEGGERPTFRLLTLKPVVPSAEEVSRNPRARSAKLRAVEKLSGTEEIDG
ncbi:MAG: 16S rRNA (cytosine(1402)-N(4))-methyltransferase RsmH [Deltaproteobacteria bacterium]|nr:16S rRNA (cytosine(1402)-N(4))-methyltransferase RsmH [Deltaproteobacteria bacterium]